MSITVAELVAVPFVKMRFHAGRGGSSRLITWAHTSDLPNAIDWLAPGDLLMSNGLSFPADAAEQVAFLNRLARADLSGFALGDDMQAPPLTRPFLDCAEELGFPVLAIPHDVPFVAISRAVASANADEEHGRLVRTLQLYESLGNGVSSAPGGPSLLSDLSTQLNCRLLLLDAATALPVLPEAEEVPAELRARLVAELRSRDGVFPGVMRVRFADSDALAVRVPGARSTALVAVPDDERPPDLALLQHAANIAALEVQRVYADREHEGKRGSELFSHLLDRSLDPASALRQLGEHEIVPEEAVLIAFRALNGDHDDLHHELAQRGLAHLALWDGQRGLVVVPAGERSLAELRRALGGEVALGVSDPLTRPDRAPDAAREARWAETAAHNLGRPLVRYGEGTPLFLPRTLGEAAKAAERILGPIVAYDAEHRTELVHSLSVFLEHNRSWQRSAEVLHVHKQTLVYRMRRVEQLTELSLHATADVVQLWLALRALEFAHGGLPQAG